MDARIVTLEGSFHGRTLATLEATGQAGKHAPFMPLAGFVDTGAVIGTPYYESRRTILLLLGERPMHGYELITELETRSDGRWRPSPAALPFSWTCACP